MNKEKFIKVIFNGLVTGGIVLLMGFGVMNIFWINNINNSNLLGLYDYKAATIGDGIFLPILVCAMTIYLFKNNILNRKQRFYSHIVGGTFAIISFMIQLSWLQNNNIRLNWTIPKRHYFTMAGWYHAFFFIVMFYFISMLLVRVWLTKRKLKDNYPTCFDEICFFMIWLAGSGFIFMFVLDDYGYKYEPISLLIVIYVLIIIFFTLYCFLCHKRIKYNDLICILSSTSTSLGIALMANGNFSLNIIFFVGNIFLSFALIVPQKNKNRLLMYMILIMFPVISLNTAATGTNILFLILVVIIPCLISFGQAKDNECKISYDICIQHITYGVILCLPGVITSFIFQFNNIETYTSIINFFVDAVIVSTGFSFIENSFKYIVNAEKKYDTSNENERMRMEINLHQVKFCSYFFIIMISIGMLMYFMLTLASFIKVVSISHLISFPSWNKLNSILLIAICIFICFLLSFKNIYTQKMSTKRKALYLSLLSMAYIVLISNIYLLRSPYVIEMKIKDLTSLFAIFMICGSSVMVAENFYSNIILIRGIQGDIITKSSAFIIGIGNFFTILCCILPSINHDGNRTSSLIYVLISLVGIIISVLILPVLAGKIIYHETKNVQVATTKPLGGILQNGFLISVFIFLGGVVPIYFCSLGKNDIEIFVGIILIIYNIYWPLSFCLKNNVLHLNNQIDFYHKLLNEQNDNFDIVLYKQIYELSRHLRRQNVLTFVAFLIYCLIPIAVELFYCLINRKSIKKEFINKYIPKTYK